MPKETFLFVPYRSGKQEPSSSDVTDSDARSHAAAVSRRRRELKVRSFGQRRTTPSPTTLSTKVVPIQESGDLHEISPTTQTSTGSISPTEDTRVQRRQHMRAMQFSWRAGTLTNDVGLSNGWRADPFGYQVDDRFAHAVTDYYARVITPVNHPVYTIFNVTNVYTTYFFELLQDSDFHHAGLAMAGAVMQNLSHPGAQHSEEVRVNQAKALARLRQKCLNASSNGSTPIDDITIVTVLALASLSRFLGDIVSYKAHRQSLSSMIKSRGGINALNQNYLTECIVRQWDSFWVFSTDGASLFPDSRPVHHPVYPAFPLCSDLHSHFQSLPIGFQTLVLQGKLSAELVEILGRASEAGGCGVSSLSNTNMYHSQPSRYHDFVEACPCLGASDSQTPNLEKQLCLALLLYCSNAFTDARSSTALYGGARGELTRILLRQHDQWRTVAERECAFWIIAVCVDSWRESDGGIRLLPTGNELLPVLNDMCEELVGGLNNAVTVLYKFFCNKELSEACQRYLTGGVEE